MSDDRNMYGGRILPTSRAQRDALVQYQRFVHRAIEQLVQQANTDGELPHTITVTAFYNSRSVTQTVAIALDEGEAAE